MATGLANQGAAADDLAFQRMVRTAIFYHVGQVAVLDAAAPGAQEKKVIAYRVNADPETYINRVCVVLAASGIDKVTAEATITAQVGTTLLAFATLITAAKAAGEV